MDPALTQKNNSEKKTDPNPKFGFPYGLTTKSNSNLSFQVKPVSRPALTANKTDTFDVMSALLEDANKTTALVDDYV